MAVALLDDMWARYQAGEAIGVIAKALGRPYDTIYWLIASRGGVAPHPHRRAAQALTSDERESISRDIAAGDSCRTLARGRAVEPASLIMRTFDAQVYMYERNDAAADSIANAVLSLDSTFLLARSVREEALLGPGRVPEAIRTLEQLVNAIPAVPATEYHAILAYVYASAGDSARARAMLDRIRTNSGGRLPPIGVLAATLERLDQTDDALALLVRARDVHDPWLPGYIASERYDRLRKNPRGAVIVESVLSR